MRGVLRWGREHCGCRQTDGLGKYLAKFPNKQIRAKRRRRWRAERRQSTGVFSGPDNSPVIVGGNKALYLHCPQSKSEVSETEQIFLRKVRLL